MSVIKYSAWMKVVAVVARWFSAVSAVAAACCHAFAARMRRPRTCATPSGARLPPVGQVLDAAVQLRGQPREDVLQIGPRVVAIGKRRLTTAFPLIGSRGILA